MRLQRLRVLQHAQRGIPGLRCASLVFEEGCPGEDVLLHEELAAGAQTQGIRRGERERQAVHPLRGPHLELRAPCGVQPLRMVEGGVRFALGCA